MRPSRLLAALLAVVAFATAPCLCLAGTLAMGDEPMTAASTVTARQSCHAMPGAADPPGARIDATQGCDCCFDAPPPGPGVVAGRLASTPPAPGDLVADVAAMAVATARPAPSTGGRASPPAPPPASVRVLRL